MQTLECKAPPAPTTDAKHRIVGGPLNYSRRTIVIVELATGKKQPFYRSTGKNSGEPQAWFPCEGVRKANGWIDKGVEKADPSYKDVRRRNPQYAEIGLWLATLDIPQGPESNAKAINALTGYNDPTKNVRLFKLTKTIKVDLIPGKFYDLEPGEILRRTENELYQLHDSCFIRKFPVDENALEEIH